MTDQEALENTAADQALALAQLAEWEIREWERDQARGTVRDGSHPDGDGTHRLCVALYGEGGDTALNWIGGSEARMLHDAADAINEARRMIAELSGSRRSGGDDANR